MANNRFPQGFLDSKLLTQPQAAELLGFHPITLSNMRVKRIGPSYVKIGNKVRYPQHLLEEWVAKTLVVPGSDREQVA